MHIVHYNTKYDSLATAATKPDGLAVLGFFYLVGTEARIRLNILRDPRASGCQIAIALLIQDLIVLDFINAAVPL